MGAEPGDAGVLAGVTGIVLAGGSSRRFGSDKAHAAWNAGGAAGPSTLLEAAVALCRSLFPLTLVAVKQASRFRQLGLEAPGGVRLVEDGAPGGGPLVGLRAGLAACPTD